MILYGIVLWFFSKLNSMAPKYHEFWTLRSCTQSAKMSQPSSESQSVCKFLLYGVVAQNYPKLLDKHTKRISSGWFDSIQLQLHSWIQLNFRWTGQIIWQKRWSTGYKTPRSVFPRWHHHIFDPSEPDLKTPPSLASTARQMGDTLRASAWALAAAAGLLALLALLALAMKPRNPKS